MAPRFPLARSLLSQAAHRVRELDARRRLAPVPLWRYAPTSQVRLPVTHVAAARVGAVDAHNHLGRWLTGGTCWMVPDVPRLVGQMDELGIDTMINLDGRWGAELEANLDRYDRAHPGRFLTLMQVDWSVLSGRGPRGGETGSELARQVKAGIAAGAGGLKVWKDLGLVVRDDRGGLVLPDDPRVAEVWDAAGDAGVPVVIHVADPTAFFAPVDRHNERLEELARHPEWSLHGKGLPSHARLLQALEAVLGAHPNTRFIGAHLASSAEDLQALTALMGRHLNLAVDLSARQAELGRQPRAAAAFIRRHADRVLWGSDSFPFDVDEVRTWFRVLETEDEHFPYSTAAIPPQGRWHVSGLGLEPAVLAQVYAGTARAWFPALGPTGAEPSSAEPSSSALG